MRRLRNNNFYYWAKNVRQGYNKKELLPMLKFGNLYGNTKVRNWQVVQAILYRLKTGCEWRKLPMKQFFIVHDQWQAVYHHFRKWSKDGSSQIMQ
jgi:transposase